MNIIDRTSELEKQVTSKTVKASDAFLSLGEKGSVIQGVISGISEQISIDFSGTTINVPKTAVQNAKEGETRKFTIMDVSKERIVLKELDEESGLTVEKESKITSQSIIVDKNYDSFVQCMENSLKSLDTDAKACKNIAIVTGDDVRHLEKDGKPASQYDKESFDRAIERIKERRDIRRQGIENYVEGERKADANVEKMAAGAMKDIAGIDANYVETTLKNSNLPATANLVQAVLGALELAGQMQPSSEAAKAFIIEKDVLPTIENIYEGTFSGKGIKTAEDVPDAVWKDISAQVEKIVDTMDAEGTKKTEYMQQAKWLFANQLPVTAESLVMCHTMDKIGENMQTQNIVESIMESLLSGNKPEQAVLDNTALVIAKEQIKEYHQISDDAIKEAVRVQIENQKPIEEISLLLLKAAQSTVDAGTMPAYAGVASVSVDIATITVKRQLEEIRLQMSQKAAMVLSGKGIDLETTGLSRIVDALREAEKEYYQAMFAKDGEQVNDKQMDALLEVTHTVDSLKEAPAYTLGATFAERFTVTVSQLDKASIPLEAKLKTAGVAYETMMTKPRADLGDSLKKAFANMESLMNEMGMDVTEENKRAVRILSYNEMEINEQSVQDMKAYDKEVQFLLKNLRPETVLDMIRNGENPLDVPIAQLNESIVQKQKDAMEDAEKFSKFLWKLEKQQDILPEERKGYIGMYRLLNHLETKGETVIGMVAKQGSEFTLGNLLTALRSRKDSGMDFQINEHLEQKVRIKAGESITDQIEAGFGMEEEYYEEKAEKLREVFTKNPEFITFLEEQNIPATAEYIQTAKELLDNKKWYRKIYKDEISSQAKELVKQLDTEEFKENYDKVLSEMEEKLIQDVTTYQKDMASYTEWMQLCSGLRLGRKMAKEGRYDIPVATKDGYVDVNLTLLQNSEEKGKIHIQTETEIYGKMQLQFTIKDKQISGLLLSDRQEGADNLNRTVANIKNELEKLGLETTNLFVCTENVQKPYLETGKEEVTNEQLYRVAKIVIQEIFA